MHTIEFILYCLKCLAIVIDGSFGNNPRELNFKTGAIGVATMFVLLGLFCAIVLIISYILKKIGK